MSPFLLPIIPSMTIPPSLNSRNNHSGTYANPPIALKPAITIYTDIVLIQARL